MRMLSEGEYSEDDCYRPARDVVEDPEVWQDYHSEWLVALWHRLKDHVASMGVYVLDTASFSDFAEFCHAHSSGRKPPC